MKTSRLFPAIQRYLGFALAMALTSLCSAAIGGEVKPASPSPEAQVHLEGTLYRKKAEWLLFVASDKAAFKKGSIQLVLPKLKRKQLEHYLINQAYVTVVGEKTSCKSKLLCVEVDSIAPALYHPLDGRSGK